jgi:hypothetical protein
MIISVEAGCEFYSDCGACVADAGCGWCSNDPKGVGTGILSSKSTTTNGTALEGVDNEGNSLDLTTVGGGYAATGELITIKGQSRRVTATAADELTIEGSFALQGIGYLASPYFGHTVQDNSRGKSIVGVHKTKFTTELKSGYIVVPYLGDGGSHPYTVQSVQSDTQLATTELLASSFSDVEFQIGNYKCSGTISYPDTSKTTLYGSWAPNPTKFTTELKDGYTIATTAHGTPSAADARIGSVVNDQHAHLIHKFDHTFADQDLYVKIGSRGTGLISGVQGTSRITGSDPCKPGNPCALPTVFTEQLMVNDVIEILNNTDTSPNRDRHYYTVASIQDNAHMTINECILQDGDNQFDATTACTGMSDSIQDGKLPPFTRFMIRSVHAQGYLIAKKADAGLSYDYTGDDEAATSVVTTTAAQASTGTLTSYISKGYAVIAKVKEQDTEYSTDPDQKHPYAPKYERRVVHRVTGPSTFEITRKFSQGFDNAADGTTDFHFESCPTASNELGETRTEVGPGFISSAGSTEVYDNVQSCVVTSPQSTTTPQENMAHFTNWAHVGYHLTLSSTGVSRTITRVLSDTQIELNRCFEEGVTFNNYAYSYTVRKGKDVNKHMINNSWVNDNTVVASNHFLYWKPAFATGGSNSRQQHPVTQPKQVYSNALRASENKPLSEGYVIESQDAYLLYAPVCYGSGRCVAKASHSLVGLEGYKSTGGAIFSSSPPPVRNYDFVKIGTDDPNAPVVNGITMYTQPYYTNCKPVCTITAYYEGVAETHTVVGTVTSHNSTHLNTELPFAANNMSLYNNKPVPALTSDATTLYAPQEGISFRVRYVTGTGTVNWCPNGAYGELNCGPGTCSSNYRTCFADPAQNGIFKLTGASKSTKTKFKSETSAQWSLTVPCTTYCINNSTGETSAPNDVANGHTASTPMCTSDLTQVNPENVTISQVLSDTYLTVSTQFSQSNYKQCYSIGTIPGLGHVTSPAGSTNVNGDTQTRFQSQLKVGYNIQVGGITQKITSIASDSALTVGSPFAGGINQNSRYHFSGKLGTGEVSTSEGQTEVYGTLDVTETKFSEELAEGYLLMVGSHYKVVTAISSSTVLYVDTPFELYTMTGSLAGEDRYGKTFGIWRNSFNYDSCFTYDVDSDDDSGLGLTNLYATKHVYVEDACEIKPGCCGYKISGTVYPDKFAYYKIRPPHSNVNIHVRAKTTEDNIDLVWRKDAVPTYTTYDNTSVRESNPWAFTIPSSAITCGETYVGYDFGATMGTAAGVSQTHLANAFTTMQTELEVDFNSNTFGKGPGCQQGIDKKGQDATCGKADNNHNANPRSWTGMSAATSFAPSNCSFFYIGVRGDNRYPQKTGASEYDMTVFMEPYYPNFLCSDANGKDTSDGTESDPADACVFLGLTLVEDAAFVLNEDDDLAVLRLTPNTNMRKGAMYHSIKLHIYDGFEVRFTFRMSGFSVGCNSVLFPSGFCGGGDGLSFVIHDAIDGDMDIGCYGAAMGFATIAAEAQGDHFQRPRCMEVSSPTSNCDSGLSTSDIFTTDAATADDGNFDELCVKGALCWNYPNGSSGCGDSPGLCGAISCTKAIPKVFAVEFDTWNNPNIYDPKQGKSRWWINATAFVGYNDNHVAIFSNDNDATSSGTSNDHSGADHFAATPSIPAMADGQSHEVKIKYWAANPAGSHKLQLKKNRGLGYDTPVAATLDCQDRTADVDASLRSPAPDHCYPGTVVNSEPGTVSIYIDDMQKPVLQAKISLMKGSNANHVSDVDTDRYVLDLFGNGYVGFTAATGGERTGVHMNDAGVSRTFDYTKPDTSAGYGANTPAQYANEKAKKREGAAQRHEILSWTFCNKIGCVPI